MVTKSLVDELLCDGSTLLEELDRQGFTVEGMFWVELPDRDYQRLVIASPVVETEGPLVAYRKLQEILQPLDLPALGLRNISVMRPASAEYLELRRIAENSPKVVARPGYFVLEDAVVYRWNNASVTVELDREVSAEDLNRLWEEYRKPPTNAPRLIFRVNGRQVTLRFHPAHGPTHGARDIDEAKRAFSSALGQWEPRGFPGPKPKLLS